jgi:hypothetical protein
MDCEALRRLFAKHDHCEATDRGLRMATHCYYPSFDRVWVYISHHGEGFRVTDGGEAARAAFMHGRDEAAFAASLRKACSRYGLEPSNGALVAEVKEADWIFAAVLAVANGAAQAASETSTKVSERKVKMLKEKIHDTVAEIVPRHAIATEFMFRGNSGHLWKIDFAVIETRRPLLLKAIVPDQNSINSNYTAFSDIAEIKEDVRRFSVHDTELKPEDKSLMLQVAELVPLASLDRGARAALLH